MYKAERGVRQIMAVNWLIMVLAISQVYLHAASRSDSFTASPPICPGDNATFTCTVCDTTPNAATYWRVEGYRHPCRLLHSWEKNPDYCGLNNSFVAELKTAERGCYYSMFNITAHQNMSGASVQCFVQGRTVGERNMEVIGAPPPPSFYPINASDIAYIQGTNEVTLDLSWSVPDNYSYTANITRYVITANITHDIRPPIPKHNSTWVIDSGTTQHSVRVPNGAVVEFTVHAEACGEGHESTPLVVHAEVPRALPPCATTAVYNDSSNELTAIVIRWFRAMDPPFQIAPGLSAETRDYTIFVNRKIMEQGHRCTGQQCTYFWKVTDQALTSYKVSVAANNAVGQGEAVVCSPAPVASLNEMVDVDVDVSTLNGHAHCRFLGAFLIAFWSPRDGRAYCEIRLGTDPTFTHLELKQQPQEIAGAGETVSVNIGALNAATMYSYNISVFLENGTFPVAVIQGFVTTPTTCNSSDLIGSHTSYKTSNRTCHIDGKLQGHILEIANGEVCCNGSTPWSVAHYSCSSGYELSEDAINPRTCRDDGRWDGSVISCESAPGLPSWLKALIVLTSFFLFLLVYVGLMVCLHFFHKKQWIKSRCKRGDGHRREDNGGPRHVQEETGENGQICVELDDPKLPNPVQKGPKNFRYRIQTKNANRGGRSRRNGKAKW